MTTATRTPGRYIGRTSCCKAPVAIEVDENTPTGPNPDLPVVSPADHRAARRARRAGIEHVDPRVEWIRANGGTAWATLEDDSHIPGRAGRPPHTRAQAITLCPKCDELVRVDTSDAVRGEVAGSACTHSCERAASLECSCTCGGRHHGRLHTI